MAKFFIKKVWGYHPPSWPLLGFGKKSGADKLAREYTTGDWIVLAGTAKEPTSPEDQRRLLGMIQVTNNIVPLEPILADLNTELDSDAFNADGKFKWPQGFPYLKALSFVDRPLIEDILPDRSHTLGRAEAAFAMPLDELESSAILALNTIEVAFPESPLLHGDQQLKRLLTQPGPVPALGDRHATYEDKINYVYVFKLDGERFYKIGRSNNLEKRLADFNDSPHARFLKKYFIEIQHKRFESAHEAHSVEQRLHKRMNKYAVGGECFEGVPEDHIGIALASVLYEFAKDLPTTVL